MRLAILSTHPVQYYAPVFRLLTAETGLVARVFYGWHGATQPTLDPGFGARIKWDIPLLDGYDYEFVPNAASDPGTHHFGGIDLPDLTSRIMAWRPDALLVFGWCWKAHLSALRHFHGRIPVLFRGDSTLLDEKPGLRTAARRLWLKWVYRHIDVALYAGTRNRQYFEAHGLKPNQLIFAPHSVDNQRFIRNDQEMQAKADAWRASARIPTEAVVLLFVGKLESKKAPELLLRAYNAAKSSSKNPVALVYCGSGEQEVSLRASAGKGVHFLGFRNQSEMPWVYRIGDVVVLPSRGPGETWGLALNEAMACKRPVIASDKVGAAIDLVRPGRTGWVFTSGDSAALSSTLQRAAAVGRDGMLQMGAAALAHISSWSLERQAQGVIEALSRVISSPT